MENVDELQNIRNQLFDQAELMWWWSLAISIFSQFLSLLTTIFSNLYFLYISGFAIISSPILVIVIREFANKLTQKADKCRRVILYSDSFQYSIPEHEILEMKSWLIGQQVKPAPFISPYYYSQSTGGSQRLIENIMESSFFTKFLANKMEDFLLIIFIAFLLITILIIYIGTFESRPIVIATLISFLLSSDIFNIYRKYSELKQAADFTFKGCPKLINAEEGLLVRDAMQQVEDYHIALIQSPPIPYKLYLYYRDEINKKYRDEIE